MKIISKSKIKEILKLHIEWLNNKEEGERANLTGANLTGADLRGANLWITQWPLWCGTRKVRIDLKIARQLAAHFCAVECDYPEYKKIRKLIIKFAMKSHVSEELELIE
jgi:hypothetical protein